MSRTILTTSKKSFQKISYHVNKPIYKESGDGREEAAGVFRGEVMEKYKLDWLEEKFTEHAMSAENQRLDMLDKWKNEFSSDKIPEHMQDTFNLPRALLTLVKEIRSLQIRSFLKDSDSYLAKEEESTEANT